MRKTKTILSVLLTAAMLLTMFTAVPFSVSAADTNMLPSADGDFTEISTDEQLSSILTAASSSGKYILTKDLTVDTSGWSISQDSANSLRSFSGELNGNGHSVTMKTNGSNNLKSLFDHFGGTLRNVEIKCENTVEGAVVINFTVNNYYIENVSVSFSKVTYVDHGSTSRACGFIAYTQGSGTVKNVDISGGEIGEKNTNKNNTYVCAAGFTENYLNSQLCIFDGINIDIDGVYVNYSNTQSTDGYAIACGAFAQKHVTGAAYKDIDVHVNDDIIAKAINGTKPIILACGLSFCTSYAHNLSVKVDGGIYAEGYSYSDYRDGIDDYGVVPFGAFGLCYKLIPIQDEGLYPFAQHYTDIGALKVEVGDDISTKAIGSNQYPNQIYSMGIAKHLRNETNYLNTKVIVDGNISTEANHNRAKAYSDGFAWGTSGNSNTSIENAEVNASNIIAKSEGYAYANGFIHSINSFSVSNCEVDVDKIEAKSNQRTAAANGFAYNIIEGYTIDNCAVNAGTIKAVSDSYATWVNGFINRAEDRLEDNNVTVDLIYADSPLQNMAGGFCNTPAVSVSNTDKICVYKCNVDVGNISIPTSSSYGDFAGGFAVVSDSNNNTIQTIIDSCEINITKVSLPSNSYFGLFISDNNSYNGNTPLNGFHLNNNSVTIPEQYVDIYTVGNYEYVKYTFSERDGRAKNVAEIPSYDNYNEWENNNTVTIGEKAYRTVCAFDDGQSVSNDGTLWQLKEIPIPDTSLKFHVNEPNAEDKYFRVYNAVPSIDYGDVEDTKETYTFSDSGVEAFYDIPAFAEDDYVFAGWYYDTDGTTDGDIPFEFDSEIPANLSDVYAHWIPVGTVSKDADDDKVLPSGMSDKYSGFGLFGVQIRPEAQFDYNMGEYYYGGLRFVSSISESLLSDIDDLSTKKVGNNKVEYGYVTAAKDTIDAVVGDERMHINPSTYKIQYKGKNVNGVDTLLDTASSDERKTPNNFRYVTNVDCTSKYDSGNGKVYGNNPRVKIDHKNFSGYRLMTFVVNYTGENAESDKGKDVVARAYIRYYDANGLLRTFYNDYGGTNVYGGCSTSFNTVKNAITGDIKTEVKK